MDMAKLCPNCMTLSKDGDDCKFCYHEGETVVNEEHQLPVMTELSKRYIIGKVLGEGNFGVTYLCFDKKHNTRVAVKEYFPAGFVKRNGKDVVSVTGGETAYFDRGMKKFKAEADALAALSGKPGIVQIRDTFEENGTAYIAMEYVEGTTLEKRFEIDNTFPEKDLLEMLKPVIKSLAEIHESGLVHRDIAPDNIIIQPDGTAKLIDFGQAAITDGSGKSTMALTKKGYSPEEQFEMDLERQGTWTDVYSLSAVIFRALTGTVPPDALTRFTNDPLELIDNLFRDTVSVSTRNAVKYGMGLTPEVRTQNAGELYAELYEGKTSPLAEAKGKTPHGSGKQEKKKKKDTIETPVQKPDFDIHKTVKYSKVNIPAIVLGVIAAGELAYILFITFAK
jgi:serine/threonine protein kinase